MLDREKEFRAWDKLDKRMIVNEQEFIPVLVTNKGVFKLDPHSETDNWVLLDSERFEITEYIGIKDVNGKKIFEGDFIRNRFWYWVDEAQTKRKDVDVLGEIIYYDKTACFCQRSEYGNHVYFNYGLLPMNDWTLEVVGNQFENPELMPKP